MIRFERLNESLRQLACVTIVYRIKHSIVLDTVNKHGWATVLCAPRIIADLWLVSLTVVGPQPPLLPSTPCIINKYMAIPTHGNLWNGNSVAHSSQYVRLW
jgi:hypothetical protein